MLDSAAVKGRQKELYLENPQALQVGLQVDIVPIVGTEIMRFSGLFVGADIVPTQKIEIGFSLSVSVLRLVAAPIFCPGAYEALRKHILEQVAGIDVGEALKRVILNCLGMRKKFTLAFKLVGSRQTGTVDDDRQPGEFLFQQFSDFRVLLAFGQGHVAGLPVGLPSAVAFAISESLPLPLAVILATFPILVALHVNAFVGALVFTHFLHSFLL